jgi:glycosyltransferase involved in cell wall biosynthesis
VISIIIPVYNSENTLRRCLDSILSQTFRNFECIIVDDGSTDKSLSICNSYSQSDKRIKVIHQNNAGVSSARNTGLNNSLGEYIAFVDSDDLVLPEMYQFLFGAITQNNADIICCGYSHRGKKYVAPDFFYSENQAKAVFDLKKAELFDYIWNKLYKKDILDINNIRFSPDQSFGEDILFNLKYFSVIHTMLNIQKVLYIYTYNFDSVSKKRPSLEKSYFRFINVSKVIIALKGFDKDYFISLILAMDFTYTVFLVRNFYIPFQSPCNKRVDLISNIRSFYRQNKAKKTFRLTKYFLFYYFLTKMPVMLIDKFFLFIFSIIYKIRGYA